MNLVIAITISILIVPTVLLIGHFLLSKTSNEKYYNKFEKLTNFTSKLRPGVELTPEEVNYLVSGRYSEDRRALGRLFRLY